ncbi:VOC family protein [Hwanghaeella sp.]|uniref:VOC family protein n=1 Tax=Hwanghaeella sp. TaxID=2605943 RepID=UPI003CCB84DE
MFDDQITFLYVSDIEHSAAFYGNRLNLPLVLVQPAGCHIYRTGKSSYIGLCAARPDKQPGGSGVVLCLVTQDVDAWYTRLSAADVPCDGPPRLNADYGIYHFYFRDPDGYLMEIQRFEKPDWAG